MEDIVYRGGRKRPHAQNFLIIQLRKIILNSKIVFLFQIFQCRKWNTTKDDKRITQISNMPEIHQKHDKLINEPGENCMILKSKFVFNFTIHSHQCTARN